MNNSPITLVGNCVRDPEMIFAKNGSAKISFAVACDRSWKDQAGEWVSETSFVEVIAWDPIASDAAEQIGKGKRVVVIGRLAQRSYEKDGQKRSVLEVVAEEIAMSTKKRKTQTDDGAAPARQLASVGAQRTVTPADEPF